MTATLETANTGAPTRGPAVGSQELIDALRLGDDRAFQIVERSFRPMLHSMARASGLCADDANDLLQETMLAVFRSVDALDQPAALSGWIRTIANRELWRICKRQSRPVPERAGISAPDLDENLVRAERCRATRNAIAQLGERDRCLLEWTVAADPPVSYGEVAVRLNCAVGSIGPWRRRALTRLRSVLSAEVE